MIQFELPFTLPSLNKLLRGNRWDWARKRNALAWAVSVAIGQQKPPSPLPRVRMRVERHAFRMLDPIDNLPGSLKGLMDVLQPFSARHPAGLGIIADDSSKCVIVSEVVQVQIAGRAEPKTVVIIEEA